MKLLEENFGNISAACARMPCSHQTYYNYRAENKDFATDADEACKHGLGRLVSAAQDAIHHHINNYESDQSSRCAIFALKCKCNWRDGGHGTIKLDDAYHTMPAQDQLRYLDRALTEQSITLDQYTVLIDAVKLKLGAITEAEYQVKLDKLWDKSAQSNT
ncbi:MAG: hypothetical protein WC733_10020 [Methylophilus sp.]